MIMSPEVQKYLGSDFADLNSREMDSKLRTCSFKFTVTAEALAAEGNKQAAIAVLPAGRVKVMPYLSQLNISGSGNYTVGLSSYVALSTRANTVAETTSSVSTSVAAGATRALVGAVSGVTYESLDVVKVIANGTFTAGQTIEGTIVYAVS